MRRLIYSPGPWRVVPNDSAVDTEATVFDIDAWDELQDCSISIGTSHCGDVDNHTAQANAKLMSAAPDLLEQCNMAIQHCQFVRDELNKDDPDIDLLIAESVTVRDILQDSVARAEGV